ncbi:DUF924 domain-containing protein [Cupriavidus sp. H19C3]|uniref:DUF924 family protein n=1 Tax=Cupriavidus sp. H19C3 TaxID=3241603 RepID=UPI003BF7E18F
MLPADAQRVLDFWFDVPGGPAWNTYRREWFRKSSDFDDTVRADFLPVWQSAFAAMRGGSADPGDDLTDDPTDDWSVTPTGACARVLLLDQLPRNMFRGDPRSFATDAAALALTLRMIARGWDRQLPTIYHRMFCLMPLQHAEDLAIQRESVRQHAALQEETGIEQAIWAERHCAIIARFGRFPHRNAVLGRTSTAEERAFLQQPGSSF